LTALPIIETQLGDSSAYIPTNVISITDGQIYLDTDLFYQGIRPAIDVGLSVSRVGGAAQMKAMKQVAGQLRLDHAQYRSLAAYAKLSADELDKTSRDQLARGDRVTGVLKQKQFVPMPVEQQVVALYAVTNGLMDDIPAADIVRFESEMLAFMVDRHADLLEQIRTRKALDDGLVQAVRSAVAEFKPGFQAQATA
jgi:F-type H+-transporting ATPase subunit alpha